MGYLIGPNSCRHYILPDMPYYSLTLTITMTYADKNQSQLEEFHDKYIFNRVKCNA